MKGYQLPVMKKNIVCITAVFPSQHSEQKKISKTAICLKAQLFNNKPKQVQISLSIVRILLLCTYRCGEENEHVNVGIIILLPLVVTAGQLL